MLSFSLTPTPLPLERGKPLDKCLLMEKMETQPYVARLARGLRQRQTSAEKILWVCLRNRGVAAVKFRRQHPLGRYIADFYCHEASLVIELEGRIHDNEDQTMYDTVRQQAIEQQGITLLRFKNADVLQDLESVLGEIAKAITSASRPLSPRERGKG